MRVEVNVTAKYGEQAIVDFGREKFARECTIICKRAADTLAETVRRQVEISARRRTGRLEKAIKSDIFSNRFQVGADVGWERTPLGKESPYTDSYGRKRKASTVADIGAILEYSETRQLRHMTPAFEMMEDVLADQIDAEIGELLDEVLF